MTEDYVPESRWRGGLAALLVVAGLLLGGFAAYRGFFAGEGASPGTDVSRVAFRDAAGVRHSLAEYRGKVVLVDVWATWCPPCRQSLPEVAQLQRAGGEAYVVLPISVDRGGWGDVRPFLAENPQLGLAAYVPEDAGSLEPFGEIRGIPTSLVIDRQGRLVKRWSGYGEGLARQALDEALRAR